MKRHIAMALALAVVLGACGSANEPDQSAVPQAGEEALSGESPVVKVFKTPD